MKTRNVVLRKKNVVVSTVNAIDNDAIEMFENKRAFIVRESATVAENHDSLSDRLAAHFERKYETKQFKTVSNRKTRTSNKAKHAIVAYLESLIAMNRYTHREVLDATCAVFHDYNRVTVATYLSDSKSVVYFERHKFDARTLTDSKTKILHY